MPRHECFECFIHIPKLGTYQMQLIFQAHNIGNTRKIWGKSQGESVGVSLVLVQSTLRPPFGLGKVDTSSIRTGVVAYPKGWTVKSNESFMNANAAVSTSRKASGCTKNSTHSVH